MKRNLLLVFAIVGGLEAQGKEVGNRVLNPGRVAVVRLTLTGEAFAEMMATAREFQADHQYVAAGLQFDDEAIETVGLRIKGNHSLSQTQGLPSLKIDFDRYIEKQKLDGLNKLNLHHSALDHSGLAEFLSYAAWRDFGVPASRTGWAEVWVNGTNHGIYVSVEQVNRQFIRRHFDYGGGDLYKPEPPSGTLAWRGAEIENYRNINLKGKGATDHAALLRFLDVINHQPVSAFSEVVDIPGVLIYLAGNAALGNRDYYGRTWHNYYLYEQSPGRFTMLPWDMNLSQDSSAVMVPHLSHSYPLTAKLFRDPYCLRLYQAIMKSFLETSGSREALHANLDFAQSVLGERLNPVVLERLRSNIDERVNWLLAAIHFHLTDSPAPRILINEIMASNSKTIADETGEFDDWIELYNPGDAAVDLGGMFMTDNPRNRRKWQFPEGTILPGQGFLLLWADGQPEQGARHLNFRLSKEGEFLGLYDRDDRANLVIDSLWFGPQARDISEGRLPDGGPFWLRQLTPTPGAPNDMTDRDQDGLPDAWELHFGLDPELPLDAHWDADGDGVSNLQEFLHGTDPRDPNSAFKITNWFVREDRLEIHWNPEPRRLYQIQWSTNLEENSWINFGHPSPSGFMSQPVPPALPGGAQFFRLLRVK